MKFPLIEDITMEVAKKYGMIQPGEAATKAVRAVFVIDPKGVIRAIIYYPSPWGATSTSLSAWSRPEDRGRLRHRHPRGLAFRRRCHRPDRRILRCGQNRMDGKEREWSARIGSSAPRNRQGKGLPRFRKNKPWRKRSGNP